MVIDISEEYFASNLRVEVGICLYLCREGWPMENKEDRGPKKAF
jgi:hypothetical protein